MGQVYTLLKSTLVRIDSKKVLELDGQDHGNGGNKQGRRFGVDAKMTKMKKRRGWWGWRRWTATKEKEEKPA